MTPPLDGLRVWVTRPLPGATASAAAWREAGAAATVVPLVRLAPRPLSSVDHGRLLSCPRPWTLALTSQNAVRFFVAALQPHADLRAALGDATAFAVGEVTADRARAAGLQVVATSSRATGSDLARLLTGRLLGGENVIVPGSDLQRPQLCEALQAAGIGVTSVVVYDTLAVSSIEPALTAELRSDAGPVVLLYSPSATHALSTLLRREHVPTARVKVGVVGPTTRQAAQEAGLQVVAAPDDPGEAALVEGMVVWWSGRLS